ncbi:hypothetical protein EGR_00963 [Echinococcus granulosus]|uniref:Uncharacterized protein n=1 Tax=Echinococcus granulosus TaxID=6210 RepID=W6VC29_ECHGR|nr:hypothetical protein EGR_00963 [Echinococcus granulosus]EUB64419.1 hypothetical protein EGR_00963 [Echinococcus granulosus]
MLCLKIYELTINLDEFAGENPHLPKKLFHDYKFDSVNFIAFSAISQKIPVIHAAIFDWEFGTVGNKSRRILADFGQNNKTQSSKFSYCSIQHMQKFRIFDPAIDLTRAKVPLTPESKRLKPSTKRPLSKMANAEANEKWKGTESMHLNQSEAKVKGPIKSEVCGTQLSRNAAESIQSSEKGFFTPPFTLSPSLIPFRFSFRQKEHNLRDHLSSSLNEMCLFGNLIRCQNKKSHAKKVKQRRYSDSAVSEEQKHENIDYICFPSRYKTKKKKLLMTEPILNHRTEQIIVKTPEVIRVSILEISNPLQPRKTLQAHCLQVKDGDDSLDKRISPNSTLSSSPSKRKTNTLGKCRKSKLRCDSGIASNFSFISTEISSSSPSLCNHQHSISLAKSPSTFFSSSSPSCLDSLKIGQNRSCMQECSPEASSLHSTHSRSSTGEQHIALVEDSIKFVDDEVSDNEIIHSERRRIDKRERFVKPGMPPLKNPNPHETVTKLSQSYRPRIMNPDSKASSDSIKDPTLTGGYDVECPEDYHLHSDISFSRSCKEQVIQGSEKSQDILNKETTHFDKRNSQKNYQKSLMESTDLCKVRKSEQKISRDTILSRTNQFDEQIPQEQFPEKLTESMDPMVNVNTFESENFRLIEKNLREEFSQNQGVFVNQFDSIQRVPNNSETEVAQGNMEALIHKALISPIKADAFESLPVSSGLQILANETNTISKQMDFVDKYLHQPEIINNQLQKQSETVTGSTQPSIILLDDLNSAVRTEGDTDHPPGLDKESSLQRNNVDNDSNNQASTTDEKNSKIQLSVDSGLGDSSKIVEASVCPQNDLVLTVRAESVESSILSEESIALPMNRSLDNVANLLILHHKANPRCQEGLLHDRCIQTHQNESTTMKKTYFLEYQPTISPNEDRAVLCQQLLPVNESVGHVMPEHFEKDVDQSDAKQGILIQQKLINFESSAPEELILSEELDSSKNDRLESDGKRTDVCRQRHISEEESCTKLERRSILLDQNCSVDVFNRETCEIIRGMLKDPIPETLWLARCAIETYDQYPSLADPVLQSSVIWSFVHVWGIKRSQKTKRNCFNNINHLSILFDYLCLLWQISHSDICTRIFWLSLFQLFYSRKRYSIPHSQINSKTRIWFSSKDLLKIFPTTASALELKSPAAVVKQSTYFQRMFPYIIVAILNLSFVGYYLSRTQNMVDIATAAEISLCPFVLLNRKACDKFLHLPFNKIPRVWWILQKKMYNFSKLIVMIQSSAIVTTVTDLEYEDSMRNRRSNSLLSKSTSLTNQFTNELNQLFSRECQAFAAKKPRMIFGGCWVTSWSSWCYIFVFSWECICYLEGQKNLSKDAGFDKTSNGYGFCFCDRKCSLTMNLKMLQLLHLIRRKDILVFRTPPKIELFRR